ncbi:MAG: hypothetical protein JRJ75_00030 [Deltaproteobacteria bacterium]|nr:hypothetical protein [Deltaproteobacteria bacterium]MBW1927624.1 hypothetical protein [Deltaproteobacteria bacterium]MBW2025577.1 hypothetical protein [Deltaproteobacteria bacterium]
MEYIMKKTYLYLIPFLCIPLLLCGCGTLSFEKRFQEPKSSLKKRVMITPLWDRAGLGNETTERLTELLAEWIYATGHAITFKVPEDLAAEGNPKVPTFGIPGNKKLLAYASEHRMNMVLTGTVGPVEKEEKRKGIWPFRKTIASYQISVTINLIEADSGTVLLTNVETDSLEMDVEEEEFVDKNWFLQEFKQNLLPKILKRCIKPMKGILSREPWKGVILSADGYIQISAGKDVGVTPGHQFIVYAPGKVVEAKGGRMFHISWEKTGKIQVTQVGETTSFAEPISGRRFHAGQKIVSID